MFLFLIRKALLFFALLISAPSLLNAMEHGFRSDDHAPIDVMGEHPHQKGELMLS